MTSQRLQRQIDRLLDEAAEALAKGDWAAVRERAQRVLVIDPGNANVQQFLAAAERGLSPSGAPSVPATPVVLPTSFVGGRYLVRKFLGEDGKKRVYLAYDATLDRDVAFALIKTD